MLLVVRWLLPVSFDLSCLDAAQSAVGKDTHAPGCFHAAQHCSGLEGDDCNLKGVIMLIATVVHVYSGYPDNYTDRSSFQF